ncbi:MAG: DUF1624 domain-containing protein, partial [Ignavibacteria bacterium]|nr:DUF1624 domain-containing protein [Ignavibacteria bacterium]
MSDTADRLYWVDVFRGLAILLMIPANLAPYYAEPHEMWYRIFGSYAAPMFIAISAGMVMLRGDRHPFRYYLVRGLLVLLIGMIIDTVLWGLAPWTSFDVLYIIGPGMILAYVARKWQQPALLVSVAVFITAAFILRTQFGYHEAALQLYFNEWGGAEFSLPSFGRLMQSWFVDGWFPVFPWLGFSLFGVWLFRNLFAAGRDEARNGLLAFGIVCAIAGFALLYLPIRGIDNFASGIIIVSRDAYSEIFYPPTIAYALSALGVVTLAALAVRLVRPHAIWSSLAWFGRSAMLVYILHQAFGYHIVSPLLERMYGTNQLVTGWAFTLLNLLVVAAIAAF